MDITVFPAELYARIIASVSPEQLPRVQKTGITLSQAYAEKAVLLEWEISAIQSLPSDMEAILDTKRALAAQYRNNSQILEASGSTAPQWQIVKRTDTGVTVPLLLEVDYDRRMFDLFVDTEASALYIRMNDDVEFVLYDGLGRVWAKIPPAVDWRVIAA